MRSRSSGSPISPAPSITRPRSAEELQAVYKLLSKSVITETKENEITSYFTALAALFVLASAGLSLLWFSRIL